MVLDFLLLITAVLGFGYASYLDLRYTEFPDFIPYAMIILAVVFRALFSFFENNFYILLNSLITGFAFLVLGLFLYFLKQWGDGDAWLLGSLGFLFPEPIFSGLTTLIPFPVILIFNLFFFSLFYLIGYSILIGWNKKRVRKDFMVSLKTNASRIKISLLAVVVFWFALLAYLSQMGLFYNAFAFSILLPLSVFIIFFMEWGRSVESVLFRKKVHVSKVKTGDVILSGKWVGLKEDQVNRLKKRGGYVWVKDGIRFVPVFLITVIITLFFGSPLLWII